MRSCLCALLLAAGLAAPAAPALSQGVPLKQQVTLADMASYSGQAMAGTAEAWNAFLGSAPAWLTVTKDSVNAIIIHQQLSKGDAWGAFKTFGEYGAGFMLGEWQAAGNLPLATITTAFQVAVAAGDFVHSQYFIPTLVDRLYADYRAQRAAGESHAQVWSELRYVVPHPVLAEVKKRAIYPAHDLTWDKPDFAKASRTLTAEAAGKAIRVTYRAPGNWPYGRPYLIHHAGQGGTPRFARTIDVEVSGDPPAALSGLMYDITKLNERYRDAGGYLDSAGLTAVEATLKRLLAEVAKPGDVARALDEEAVAYVGRMLELRYAREVLTRAVEQASRKARDNLVRARLAYDEFLKSWQALPEGPPVIDLPCCRYWLVQSGGERRLVGRYVTPKGTAVIYRSEPMADWLPLPFGLVAVQSGVGYHIYPGPCPASRPPGSGCPYLVARLGETAEVIFRQEVSRFSCQNSPADLSYLKCDWQRLDAKGTVVAQDSLILK
ncbi:hypothetical protein SAMN06265365_101428 [Tistlia consotensis]|uniref:Uncharacterized protein n=1 Tax=Tistlia consotensis USBA 355 TaxID=560819 RepID=A0A1Y6B9H9_9PROT|nr:hypothetical protein [Tistlia consotensis]SME91690.1 hypothetical protein SAMN05428998_101426 [Tistlia consotensis USBA 355]SNR27534.1 hypothetical protein SAMN06265365_101428 [Tistlia consotensis]